MSIAIDLRGEKALVTGAGLNPREIAIWLAKVGATVASMIWSPNELNQ